MAISKNPLIRYKILDQCFRNPFKIFTIDVLLKTLNEELFEIMADEKQTIKLRQLQDDIAFMKSSEGWGIELAELKIGKKNIYRYEDLNFSILNSPLNNIEIDQFKSAIQTLSQFEGMPQFEGIQEIIAKLKTNLKLTINETPFIGFDRNQDLKGLEYFNQLYYAVQNNQVLEITYQDFKSEKPFSFELHPYYLKEYNNRWFLFGLNTVIDKFDWNVAIDRIISLKIVNTKFKSTNVDWQDYFSDMIGVTKIQDSFIEEVILHFDQLTGKYMVNKSIHETQKHKWLDENTLELKIKVLVNYELERLILSYGESVKIIEPQHLKFKIEQRIQQALKNYE
ncbi:MAG: WYL domain-containing protein [Pedobacter sp.]|nr:MAG: WYL domain-containing protein [Pedobacter sp.]